MFWNFNKVAVFSIIASASFALGGCSSADSERAAGGESSSSAATDSVPKVEGSTLFSAVTTLKDMGFSYKIEGDNYPGAGKANNSEWRVTDQEPEGEQDPGEDLTVTLVVEKIKSPSKMPSNKDSS